MNTTVTPTAPDLIASEAVVSTVHYAWPLACLPGGCDLCAVQPDGITVWVAPYLVGAYDMVPVPLVGVTVLNHNTELEAPSPGDYVVDLCLAWPTLGHRVTVR